MTELLERFGRLRVSGLADEYDKLGLVPPLLARELEPIGEYVKFSGLAFCVKGRKHENAGWLAVPGPRDELYDSLDKRIAPGAVLIYDTGGYDDTAVFGAGMGLALKQRSCAGAVIDGAVRDVSELISAGLPTRARTVSAIRFMGRFAVTDVDVSVEVRGLAGPVTVNPADFVLADRDGIIVVAPAVAARIIDAAEEADRREALVRAAVLEGLPRRDAAKRHKT